MSPVRRARASYSWPRLVAEKKSLSLAARLAVQILIEWSIWARSDDTPPAGAPGLSTVAGATLAAGFGNTCAGWLSDTSWETTTTPSEAASSITGRSLGLIGIETAVIW